MFLSFFFSIVIHYNNNVPTVFYRSLLSITRFTRGNLVCKHAVDACVKMSRYNKDAQTLFTSPLTLTIPRVPALKHTVAVCLGTTSKARVVTCEIKILHLIMLGQRQFLNNFSKWWTHFLTIIFIQTWTMT